MATVIFLGRPPTSAVTDAGSISAGTMRASIINPTSQTLWLRALGARIGPDTAGSRTVILAAYETDGGDLSNADLIAQTDSFTASTVMTSASDGANEEHDVATPVLIQPNSSIAIDIICVSGGTLTHGMVQSANLASGEQQDRNFYDRAGTSPPDPFGDYTAHFEGALAAWAVCDVNVAPHVPVNRSATNLASGTPTFAGDFRDDNGAFGGDDDAGDLMRRYRIQVRDKESGSIKWNPAPFFASSEEQTNNQFSRVYAGAALTPGDDYEWRTLVEDLAGVQSDWSSWLTFTIPSQGTVTNASFSGKQETLQPTPFTARWTHADDLSMAKVQIRIRNVNGTVVLDSGEVDVSDVASSDPPGTQFTVSWTTAFPNNLSPGGAYTSELRGKDTSGNWSPWSNQASFSVNAAPNVPIITNPQPGQIVTSRPLVQITASDADDTSGTGLVVKLRIKDESGTVLFTRDTTNVSGDQWEYQTDSTDLEDIDETYKFDAYAFDGTWYSGGAITIETNAVVSDEVTVQYLTGPALAIDSPADDGTVDTSTPTFEWTAATQSAFKIRLYDGVTDVLLRATNGGDWTVSAQQSYAQPAGWLHNGGSYRWEIDVRDDNLLTATASGTFSVVFTPPDDVPLTATPYQVGNEPTPSAIRLQWEQSTDPDFVFYDLYRDDLPGPLARLTGSAEIAYIDYVPVSGHVTTYTLRVVKEQDDEQISSAGSQAEEQVTLKGLVLTSVTHPTTVRLVVERTFEWTDTPAGVETVYQPWGAVTEPFGKPTTISGAAQWWETKVKAHLIDTPLVTALRQRQTIEGLPFYSHTFCQRDSLGRKRFVVFPAQSAVSLLRQLEAGHDTVELMTREETYAEGVEVTP